MQPSLGIGGRISDKQGGYSIVYSLTRPDFVLIRMCKRRVAATTSPEPY